ncbi:uncharacterized protein LOC108912099 [Anoplophora glabripennis]|uniref:uncharacterized protein LOC108912099 n=1 Tax=Anoplophora glabripennis TaxID=217634 RepID=UPI0008739144|nr:uncharacterized protein LOC108912099 [Anoplophora glabripennis]
MAQDVIDSAIFTGAENNTKGPSIQTLNSEMPNKESQKENRKRVFKSLLNRLRCKKYASAAISKPDPTYRVAYLGNVVTGWAKGEGCVEKPLATLWRNYTQSSRPDVRMQLTVSAGGLKATTKDHGLTEYWAHRLTTCAAPDQFPRLFCWVYRHEGRRLRHELRCHAVLCSTAAIARQIEMELKQSLALALHEFKRDKVSRQNARLSLVNSLYENPTIPRRKILLSTGSHNYKPPLERSKSAPKLTSIEEIIEEDDTFQSSQKIYKEILKHYDSTSSLLGKRNNYLINKFQFRDTTIPITEDFCNEKEVLSRKVQFENGIEDLTLDEKSDMILEELVQNSLRNDLLETCERAWFNALREKPDLIPHDSDEGSLSSGCDSASTIVSDVEQVIFPTINEIVHEEEACGKAVLEKKTDLEFIVGNNMLSRVRSFEKIANTDILKYCGLNTAYNNTPILDQDEVSLIPVGESHSDFSSLKVYKKRSMSEPTYLINIRNRNDFEEEENGSACSDESGFEEDELASSIGNIVLV